MGLVGQFCAQINTLFVETFNKHLNDPSHRELVKWLLNDNATRLNLLVSGGEKLLLKEIMEAEAGTCA